MYLTASGSGEWGAVRTAPIARLVPASAAVPTPAANHEQNHDDDQKCRGVHADLLEMIMGRRVSRPDGSPTWQSWLAVRRLSLGYAAAATESVQY
jgi:hypothetical protein